jgi:phosphoribosyl 1,2-cyclic phosphate phosphodiesterase
VHLVSGDISIVVDVGADFRDQVLTFGVTHLDALFITHEHADHVMGLDDVRRFTWKRETPLNIYAHPEVCIRLQTLYPYVAPDTAPGKAVPQVAFRPWSDPVSLGDLTLTPFPVPHGGLPCYGIRIDSPEGSIGYVPDCSDLPADIRHHLKDLDVMILNALRIRPHPNHLTFDRSRELLEEVGASRSFFTHMGCPLDYTTIAPTLPGHLEMAYDGLTVSL